MQVSFCSVVTFMMNPKAKQGAPFRTTSKGGFLEARISDVELRKSRTAADRIPRFHDKSHLSCEMTASRTIPASYTSEKYLLLFPDFLSSIFL
jgi:hypothetical protein